ncbi:Vitellogenin-5 [Halotydeus destructor]|nr:Vitellogenin-5 [Halotydeus destructor]
MLFTIFLVGLMASASIATNTKPGKPIQFAPGQTYVYEYTARLLTGIPELADQYSGFEMTADLVLQARGSQNEVDMKLTNVKVGKTNDPVSGSYEEDIDMVHRWNKEYQRELTKPVRFVHQQGKVASFQAERNEPGWSLNIKKSILSLFNLNLTPDKIIRAAGQQGNLVPKPVSAADLTYYGVYERGMGGICETVYEIDQSPNPYDQHPEEAFVLNVTKTRNYDNCLTEPIFVKDNFDLRGCPAVCRKERSFSAVKGYHPVPDAVTNPYTTGCQCGNEPEASPVDQYNFVKYNISLVGAVPIIQGLWSEGKVVYNTFGDKIMVVTHQNATLSKLLPARQVTLPVIQNPVRHEELGYRVSQPQIPAGPKALQDIPFYAIYGQPDVPELASNLPPLFDNLAAEIIAADPSASKDSMHRVVQIVNSLAVMPAEALEALYKEIAQAGRDEDANQKQQIIRKLFLDALPLTGTNAAAKLIKQLIVSNLVDTYEAKQMVEAVPQNMFLPDVTTIDAWMVLLQSPRVQARRHLKASIGIAFGKLVREGCVNVKHQPGDIPDENTVQTGLRNRQAQRVIAAAEPQSARRLAKRSAPWNAVFAQTVCSEQDILRYVKAGAILLERANTFHDKIIAIETLAHMGVPEVLQVLEPYVTGTASAAQLPGYPLAADEDQAEEANFVRMNAIYALSHITGGYPKQVLPLVLPVFRDINEPYEVRIAAFTMLMLSDPETQILESIAAELHRENNKQVTSFVISAFENIGNLTTPCYRSVADSAAEAADFAPDSDLGLQYSKFMANDYFDEDRDFGLYNFVEWTANNVSWVPRAAYFSVGQVNGPFNDESVVVGFTQKGMEAILNRIVGKKGLLNDMLESLNAKNDRRVKRNTDSVDQALAALKDKLNFKPRTDDTPKATVFFKLFESTSYYALDDQYVKQLIDEAEDTLKDWAQQIIDGYSGHFVKLFMPASLNKVVPSELGIPVIVAQKHPLILSLKVDSAKLDLTVHPKTPYPIGFNITAQLTPQVMYSSMTYVFGVSPAYRVAYGTHVEKTTVASLPMEITVGHIRPKNLWTVSLIPKVPHEVLYHNSEAKTFITRAKIASAPTRDWLEDSNTINTMAAPFKLEKQVGQDMLGLGLRVQLNSEDEWHNQPFWNSETAKQEGLVAALVEEIRNPGLQARELHVTLEADDETPTYGFDATFRYKWTADEENISDDDDSDESSQSDESDSDDSDHSSSSDSSSSSESNSSRSRSNSRNSKSHGSSESDSSDTSEDSSSDSAKDSKSGSDSSDSSSESNSVSDKVRKARKIKGVRKPSGHIHVHRHSGGNSDSSSSSESGSNSSGSKSSASLSASSSSASSSSSSSEESESSPETSEESSSEESDSSSSSSSESDESYSAEEAVFDYEDIMELITGHAINEKNIKKIALHLIRKTRSSWIWAWDEDEENDSSSSSSSSSDSSSDSSDSSSESDDSDSSSSDESESRDSASKAVSRAQSRQSDEKDIIPAFETHDFTVTVTARGPRPTYLAMNLMVIQTFDRRALWVKANGKIKTPQGIYMEIPDLFCADAVVAFPQMPGEFYFDQTTQQEAKARVKAELGWGRQCHTEGGILITGQLEKTEDQIWSAENFAVQDGATGQHVQDWFYAQCQEDRADGKPASYACERAIIKESYFNQLTLDVKYKHMPQEVKNLTRKLDLAIKVALYDNLEENESADNPEDQLRLVAQYSSKVPDVPMVDIEIKKPTENIKFEKIFAPYFRPLSTLLPIEEIYMNLWTNYENTPACVVMEQAVRTFDNVTFDLPETNCQVLVAMDGSPQETFAVYATELDHASKTKKVTVLTAGMEIKLLPPQQQDLMQIEVDGRVTELTADKPISFGSANDALRITLRKTKSDAVNPIAVIENPDDDLTVIYDGKNVKVLLEGNQYRGKTVGICGNNDDEEEDEFEGPAEAIFEDSEDFVNAYSMAGEHCEAVPQAKGYVRYPRDDERKQANAITHETTKHTRRNPTGQTTVITKQTTVPVQAGGQQPMQQRKPCESMRTEYVMEGDMVCFTTKPMLVCQAGCHQVAAVEQEVSFHCLPKASPFTKALQAEADKSVLRQLANKRVDFKRPLNVASRCQA